MEDFFDNSQVEAGVARNPLKGATRDKPVPVTLVVQGLIFSCPAHQVDKAVSVLGWPLWTREGGDMAAPCQIKAPGIDKETEKPYPSGVMIRFFGGIKFAPAEDGYQFAPMSMEADARNKPAVMWPLVPKPGMAATSWSRWVEGADATAAAFFEAVGHPLRPHEQLARMMPVAVLGDMEPVGLTGVFAVLKDIGDKLLAAAIDDPIEIRIGAYTAYDEGGFSRIELGALPAADSGKGKRR